MVTPKNQFFRGDEPVPDRSAITLSVDITLIIFSSIFLFTRLYVRKFVSNTLGLDDFAALISFVRSLNAFLPATVGH